MQLPLKYLHPGMMGRGGGKDGEGRNMEREGKMEGKGGRKGRREGRREGGKEGGREGGGITGSSLAEGSCEVSRLR